MIRLDNLRKLYPKTLALNDISLKINQAKIIGLVGPNGSGKTTLIKCLLKQIDFEGKVIWSIKKPNVFYIPDDNILPDLLTGNEYLSFVESLFKLDKEVNREELIQRFKMENDLNKLIQSYSYGMKKKIQIIASMMANCQILILDEIFRGLDMLAIRETKIALQEYASKGGTILLSSHDIVSVELLCDEVIFLHNGVLKAHGTPKFLCKISGCVDLETLFMSIICQG